MKTSRFSARSIILALTACFFLLAFSSCGTAAPAVQEDGVRPPPVVTDLSGFAQQVQVSVNGGALRGYNNLAAALDSIGGNAGIFHVFIGEDQDIAPRQFAAANQNVTLIGVGGERRIRLSSNGSMFIVGRTEQPNVNTIALTIGENITLVGRSADGHGGENNNAPLVAIRRHASFTMLPGSKITGNTSTSNTFFSAGVQGNIGGRFIMKGGIITGNHAIGTHARVAGGLFVTSDVNLRTQVHVAGEITGNTGRSGDVLFLHGNVTTNTLAGNGTIGELFIHSNNNADSGFIILAQDWTGSIGTINFGGGLVAGTQSLDAVTGWWNASNVVMRAETGRTLTEADFQGITMGIIRSVNGDDSRPVSQTHRLALGAGNTVRLVAN